MVVYIRAEREKYYKHGIKGNVFLQKCLSLIIDGMDQSKLIIPHTSTISKVSYHIAVPILYLISYLERFTINDSAN